MTEDNNSTKEKTRNKIITVRLTDRQYDFLDKWKTDLEDYLNMEIPMGACIRRILDGFINDFHGSRMGFRDKMDARRRHHRENFPHPNVKEDFGSSGAYHSANLQQDKADFTEDNYSPEDISIMPNRNPFKREDYKDIYALRKAKLEELKKSKEYNHLSKEERIERIKAYINKYNEEENIDDNTTTKDINTKSTT